jgi:hypothetical protein
VQGFPRFALLWVDGGFKRRIATRVERERG